MLRTLPVVGHPIRLRAIFQTFLKNSDEGILLEELTSDSRIFLLSSGSAALTLSLRSLKHRSSKKQVIVPAYTCPSVLASVIKAGLEPVLCDLKEKGAALDKGHITC